MKRIIARANKQISVGWAATLLSGSFLGSALLGLLRERLLLANFGLGPTLDAYYIAFSIPDFIFFLLISGALSVTFIPVISEQLVKGNKKAAWDLSSSLLNLIGRITLLASVLIMIFSPWLVGLIAGGASPEVQDKAADLMRIVAVNPFIFGLASIMASMQQAVGRFFFNSLAPIIYNLGIIIGIVFFAPAYGIRGVALGVGLGAMLQLVVQGFGLVGLGYRYHGGINWRNAGLIKVLKTLPARSFDQSIDNIMAIFQRFLASFLFAGAIASYQTAYTLRNVPITLIGAAIANAAFPKFSSLAVSNKEQFKKVFISIIRAILWLSLPAAVIAFVMRGYLVRLLLGSGSATVALVLGWLSLSIVFRALFQVVTRAFYAHQDTKTPLYTSIAALLLNIVLSVLLVTKYGLSGLAIAQSAVGAFEVILLFILLEKRLGRLLTTEFRRDGIKMVIAAAAMSIFTYTLTTRVFPLLARDTGFFALAPKFILIVAMSAAAYLAFSVLLRIKETKPITAVLSRIVFKPVKIDQR